NGIRQHFTDLCRKLMLRADTYGEDDGVEFKFIDFTRVNVFELCPERSHLEQLGVGHHMYIHLHKLGTQHAHDALYDAIANCGKHVNDCDVMSFAYQRGSGLDAGRAGAYYGNRVSY